MSAPMLSPEFRLEGVILQYKPYPAYEEWLNAWDLTDIFTGIAAAIDVERLRAIEQEEQAQSSADFAYVTAAAAQDAVNALDVRVTALENP